MKKWLTHKLIVPRWVILSLMILSIFAFVLMQSRAHDLHQKTAWLESELLELTCGHDYIERLCSVDPLGIPLFGTITGFAEMQIAFICIVLIIVGGWRILFQRARIQD